MLTTQKEQALRALDFFTHVKPADVISYADENVLEVERIKAAYWNHAEGKRLFYVLYLSDWGCPELPEEFRAGNGSRVVLRPHVPEWIDGAGWLVGVDVMEGR